MRRRRKTRRARTSGVVARSRVDHGTRRGHDGRLAETALSARRAQWAGASLPKPSPSYHLLRLSYYLCLP